MESKQPKRAEIEKALQILESASQTNDHIDKIEVRFVFKKDRKAKAQD